MKRLVIIAVLSLALAGAAHGFGLGLGNTFGHLGASPQAGGLAPPPTGCASGVISTANGCPLPMLGM